MNLELQNFEDFNMSCQHVMTRAITFLAIWPLLTENFIFKIQVYILLNIQSPIIKKHRGRRLAFKNGCLGQKKTTIILYLYPQPPLK
jgi:hypothetical protein